MFARRFVGFVVFTESTPGWLKIYLGTQLVGIAVMASDLPIYRIESDFQYGPGPMAIGACMLAR